MSAEFEARQTEKAVDDAIVAYKNMSTIIEKDLNKLINDVQILSTRNKDQNFDAFKKAITPRQDRLKVISEKCKELSRFVENDLKPKYLKYKSLSGEYDG